MSDPSTFLGTQGPPVVAAQDAGQAAVGAEVFDVGNYNWLGAYYLDPSALNALYAWMVKHQDSERWTCFSDTVPNHWLENELRLQVLRVLASRFPALAVGDVVTSPDAPRGFATVECGVYDTGNRVHAQMIQVVNNVAAQLGQTPKTVARWWRTADHYGRTQLRRFLDMPDADYAASRGAELSDEYAAKWRRWYVWDVDHRFQHKRSKTKLLARLKAKLGASRVEWIDPLYVGGNALVVVSLYEPTGAALRAALVLSRDPEHWAPEGHSAAAILRAMARRDYWSEAHATLGIMPPDGTGNVQAVVRVVDRLVLHEIIDRLVPAQTNADPHAWRVPAIVTRWLYAWWRGVFGFARRICPHSFVLATLAANRALTLAPFRRLPPEHDLTRMVICNSGACARDRRTYGWVREDVEEFVRWLRASKRIESLKVPHYPLAEGEAVRSGWNEIRWEYMRWQEDLAAAGGAEMLRAVRGVLVEARHDPQDPSSALYGLPAELVVDMDSSPNMSTWWEARAQAWGISFDSDLEEEPIEAQTHTIQAWTSILDAYFSCARDGGAHV